MYEVFMGKVSDPCVLDQEIPLIDAAKSPPDEAKVMDILLLSGVNVLTRPKTLICRLQEAMKGTLLCSVTVKTFDLQGQGEL